MLFASSADGASSHPCRHPRPCSGANGLRLGTPVYLTGGSLRGRRARGTESAARWRCTAAARCRRSTSRVREGGLRPVIFAPPRKPRPRPWATAIADGGVRYALSYVAVSSDESAVTVAVAGATLTLSPVVHRRGDGEVTAADPYGLTAVRTFGVSVGDLLVREVLTDALAALARAHLSSARERHRPAAGIRRRHDAADERIDLPVVVGSRENRPFVRPGSEADRTGRPRRSVANRGVECCFARWT